ncbi:MAG: hypothetical protein ACYS8X_14035 [Planctomycetota bacterium]
MSKCVTLTLLIVILAATGTAWAQDAARPAAEAEGTLGFPHAIAIIGACIGAALAALGGGWAISGIGGKTIDAIARQPEASGPMFAPMIISAAMVEIGMLFAIVVCMLGVLGL